jgi:ComF family protein
MVDSWLGVLDALSQCHVCRAWPTHPLCEACVARFAPVVHRCQGCGLALPAATARCGTCLREPPPWQRAVAAVSYGFPWAGLIGRFKFQDDPGLARPLAQLMRANPAVEDALAQATHLLPVPLSAQRLRQRGYNQAQLLAQALAPALTRSGWLLRTRDTPAQHGLPRAQRLLAQRGAFALDPLRAPALRGQSVLLLDDVMTTGASLRACAEVLQQAGVAELGVLVLARTE